MAASRVWTCPRRRAGERGHGATVGRPARSVGAAAILGSATPRLYACAAPIRRDTGTVRSGLVSATSLRTDPSRSPVAAPCGLPGSPNPAEASVAVLRPSWRPYAPLLPGPTSDGETAAVLPGWRERGPPRTVCDFGPRFQRSAQRRHDDATDPSAGA